MSTVIRNWLLKQFNEVADVRQATMQPDKSVIYQAHSADLVVSTWMGARLYVYLCHTEPKLRDIRGILKENSRNGIGTLFIVNGALLPKHDSLVKLTDWQDGLSSLHDLFIYTYALHDGQLSITQVHFSPMPNDEYRVWHFRNFEVENVSVRKRDVQSSVRGNWFLGDIASPSYKRRVSEERAQQRFHYRTKYTQNIPPSGSTYHKRTDELEKYYTLLEVDANASEADIKRAFRRKALQFHPDVSALPRDIANERFIELNAAYDYIKNYHGWA